MLTPDNLKVMAFATCKATSNGEPVEGTRRVHHVLFNCTRITEKQVRELIDSGMWEYSEMIVEVTPQQLRNLKDKEEA